jgi:hypothetical protein
MKREGREFPSCPYNWSCIKEEEEGRKYEEEKKGRGVVMAQA